MESYFMSVEWLEVWTYHLTTSQIVKIWLEDNIFSQLTNSQFSLPRLWSIYIHTLIKVNEIISSLSIVVEWRVLGDVWQRNLI